MTPSKTRSPDMARTLDIAIAGAGIAGLAAAILLRRDGHSVTVFDRFDAPAPVGSGLMLQETGLAVLAALGLREAMQALGEPIYRLHGKSVPGDRTVLDVRFKALSPDLSGYGVQRRALFDLLLEGAEACGAALVPGTDIQGQSAGLLSDRKGRQLGPFDVVVDALGARSPLSSRPKSELPYGALWTTLPWPEDGPFDPTALEQRYENASKMAGVMGSGRASPDQPRTATYFWSLRRGAYTAWRRAPLDHWKAEAAALWPETAGLIDQITDHDQLAFARYRHRTHPKPVEDRCVHIGDSWHAASPQLGQGANMALLDAFALAKALREHSHLEDGLAGYGYLRQRHVAIYQWMTWAFTPVYQSQSRILPLLRDGLAAPLSRVPPAPQVLAAMVSGAVGRPLKALGLVA